MIFGGDGVPSISVIMPCLNVAKYIDECIRSVINQTIKDIEIIIIDAGSTDGTIELAKKYCLSDARICLVHSDKKSYGYQMNLGTSLAKGEYISIVETDDYIEQDMLEVLYREAKKSDADYVKGTSEGFFRCNGFDWRFEIIPCEGVKEQKRVAVCPMNRPDTFIEDNFLWNGIYRKKLLKNVKFNETPGAAFQDIGVLFRIFTSASKGVYLDHKVYNYRQDNSAASSYNKKSLLYTDYEYTQIKPLLNHLSQGWIEAYYNKLAGLTLNRFIFMGSSGEYWSESADGIASINNELRSCLNRNIHFDLANRYEVKLFCEDPHKLFEYEQSQFKLKQNKINNVLYKARNNKVYICGAGVYGRFLHAFLNVHGIRPIQSFCDNNRDIVGKSIQGLVVENLEEVVAKDKNALYIIATKKQYADEIEKQLLDEGISPELIVKYSEGTDLYLLKENL